MAASPTPTNQLADETSPYLLQHAHNPVAWLPWGPEALERARREDKPILLSIGYAACHWCHVMAHESFEDEATARRLNERFVAIKVDREERPDLDAIYQQAHRLLTGRGGGWPLTMFLAPDGRPFFGGTYFPREPLGGMPGFGRVLEAVAELYARERSQVADLGRRVAEALATGDALPGTADEALDPALLDALRRDLGRTFDPVHGGMRGAPKFPQVPHLDFLARWSAAHPGDAEAAAMLRLTLERMARGGIFDQLGGGFFRYATDESWTVPHFEKMLYDNALLLGAYADAWHAMGDELFRRTAVATGEWLLRELRTTGGGFASSLDADSGGVEGGFYLWDDDEVRGLLEPAELRVARVVWGVARRGNVEGRCHLAEFASAADAARRLGLSAAEVERLRESARTRLRAARARRPRPAMDDKVLTSWNALAVAALARAGRLLDRPDFVDAAFAAADFLRRALWRDGRLLASWRDGRARHAAYLDDHAFLIDALLELLQTRWRNEDLEWSIALADLLVARFEDREGGGFFFTADDHETLIQRPKPGPDTALPSGNGVAARVLLRLGGLLGRPGWLAAAERTVRALADTARGAPLACATVLVALGELADPGRIAVLRGEPTALEPWRRAAAGDGRRDAAFVIPADQQPAAELAARRPQGDAVAYVCRGMHCSTPFTDLDAFRKAWTAD